MLLSPVRIERQATRAATKAARVLIVCHDRYLSGANRALLDWLADRDRTKTDITVLLPRNNANSRARFEALGCEVWSAPFVLPVKFLKRQGFGQNLKNFAKLIWSICVHPILSHHIARKALTQGIEIVHSNSFATTFGSEVAQAMKVPHVWHIREFCEADHGFTHYFPSRLARQCQRAHAIFISDVVREYQTQRHRFKSTTTIYDQVQFDSSVATERSFMEDGVCNVIMVGAISEGKGQAEAVEAIKALRHEGRSVHLYLCGQGDRGELRASLSACEDFVFDLGYREDVNCIRSKMDIALVCSRMEAFGRVTIEGQYYGNVVIGADAGCTPYLIEDGETGFLYRKGSSEDLAKKISYCMDEAGLMPSIVGKAREMAVCSYANSISEKIYEIYRQELSSSSSLELWTKEGDRKAAG